MAVAALPRQERQQRRRVAPHQQLQAGAIAVRRPGHERFVGFAERRHVSLRGCTPYYAADAPGVESKKSGPTVHSVGRMPYFQLSVRWRAQRACAAGARNEGSAVAVIPADYDTDVHVWIDRLKDRHAARRLYAAGVLSQLGPCARAAVPALSEALKDPMPEVRRMAVVALAEIGPEARAGPARAGPGAGRPA